MNSIEDIGEITSFANDSYQKGLLTFYEEQWVKMSSSSMHSLAMASHGPKRKISKNLQNKNQSYKQSRSMHGDSKFPLLFAKSKVKTYQGKDASNKVFNRGFRLSDKNTPLNLYALSEQQKPITKQTLIKSIENNILRKEYSKQRLREGKERKAFEFVHIHNYPFSQEEQDEETALNKLKKQIERMRIKKGTLFKGLHRQNVSISAIQLEKQNKESKELLQEIVGNKDNRNKILEKTLNKYKKYSSAKHVVKKYLFPIISPRLICLKKSALMYKNTEMDDTLHKIMNYSLDKAS